MSKRSRKYINILGHKFRRDTFYKAFVSVLVFVTLIASAWIVLLLVQKRREEAVLADKVTDKVPSISTEIPVSAEPSELELFIQKQRAAVGFPLQGVLKLSGQEIDQGDARTFTLWLSSEGIRIQYADEAGPEIYASNFQNVWRLSTDNSQSLEGTPKALQITQISRIFDPLARYGKKDHQYQKLLNQEFRNQPCSVVGLRVNGEREVRMFFNADSLAEIRRLVWLVGQPNGQREILFSQYNRQAGLLLPGKVTFKAHGSILKEMTFAKAELLEMDSDALFKPGALQEKGS